MTMKFKIDENLPVEVSTILDNAGHDSTTVPQQNLEGSPDLRLSVVCQQEHRALVTLDLDFADIRLYPPQDYAGIIVLRLSRLSKTVIQSVMQALLPILSQEPLAGKLWIVDEMRVRIRDG